MAAFLDGCRFNPTAGGTTDWTYSSAVTGYQSPAAANVVNGRLYKYRAESSDLSQWELGEGAYNTSTGVLARTTVLYNSSGGTSKISFTTLPQVAIVALKEDLISVEEANGFTATQQAQARQNIGVGALGQCILALSSGNVVLTPLNGNLLSINGVQCTVPHAGVSLAPTGLSVGTLYYIYATQSGGVINALVASTTAHSISTTAGNKGVAILTGNDNYTLVGMVYVVSGPAFADSATQRLVRSWFNRNSKPLQGSSLGSSAGLNATIQEVSSNLRVGFLVWTGEVVSLKGGIGYYSSVSGSIIAAELNLDGSNAGPSEVINTDGSGHVIPMAVFYEVSPAEGYHYVTIFASLSSGSASFYNNTVVTGSIHP
jgi:hypothetical protein